MIRAAALALLISSAPFQCGGGNAPAREESAGDALWDLAEDFEAKGNHDAARHTLEVLVQKYPSNRHAEDAKHKLESLALVDGG